MENQNYYQTLLKYFIQLLSYEGSYNGIIVEYFATHFAQEKIIFLILILDAQQKMYFRSLEFFFRAFVFGSILNTNFKVTF